LETTTKNVGNGLDRSTLTGGCDVDELAHRVVELPAKHHASRHGAVAQRGDGSAEDRTERTWLELDTEHRAASAQDSPERTRLNS